MHIPSRGTYTWQESQDDLMDDKKRNADRKQRPKIAVHGYACADCDNLEQEDSSYERPDSTAAHWIRFLSFGILGHDPDVDSPGNHRQKDKEPSIPRHSTPVANYNRQRTAKDIDTAAHPHQGTPLCAVIDRDKGHQNAGSASPQKRQTARRRRARRREQTQEPCNPCRRN